MRLLFAAAAALAQACTTPMPKDEIRRAEFRNEGVLVEAPYQALMKCWDDRAEKVLIDGAVSTFSSLYPDLGYGEIYVGVDSKRVAVLIELRKHGGAATLVNAYGTGYIGGQRVPEWLGVLKSCATSPP